MTATENRDDLEAASSPLQQSSGKLKLSRRKRWAICGGIAVVVCAAVGMIGLFVIGPLIAKSSMANSVIKFDTLNMTCVPSNESILVAAELTISHVAPLGCSIGAMELTVMYKDRAFAKLSMPPISVQASQDNHRSVGAQLLRITDVQTWGEVSSTMLRSESMLWRLKADASVTAGLMGLSVTFNGVPFDKEVTFRGFNAFASDMKVLSMDVLNAKNGTLELVADVEVTNPANIMGSMGPLSLELWSPGSEQFKLGALYIPDFKLNANSQGTAVTKFSRLQATYRIPSGSAAAVSRAFLSNFVQGISQNLSIRGTADGTPMHLLKPAMSNFVTSSAVPGSKQNRMLIRSLMHIPNPLHPHQLPTQLVVQNPFSADMVFQRSHCEIYPCQTVNGETCSQYYEESVGSYTTEPINEVVPGKSHLALKLHPVTLSKLLTPEMIMTAFSSAGGGSFIWLKGSLTLSLADTQFTIDYEEKLVPICLVYPFHECAEFLSGSQHEPIKLLE